MIRIGLIGTQGSGKTTLMHKLKNYFTKEGLRVDVLSEIARECPLPINEQTTILSQLWIFSTQIKREIERKQNKEIEIFITDRTILDSIAYTYNVNKEVYNYMLQLSHTLIDSLYDYIVFMPLNYNYLKDDGVRDINKQFAKDIDNIMSNILESLRNNHNIEQKLINKEQLKEIFKIKGDL